MLVARVVSVLQRVPEVSEVWVVGHAERLAKALDEETLRRELVKPLWIVPQYRNLYENAWYTYRRLLPGAGAEGRDPTPEEEEQPVLYLSTDLPFATPQEISEFVRKGLVAGRGLRARPGHRARARGLLPEGRRARHPHGLLQPARGSLPSEQPAPREARQAGQPPLHRRHVRAPLPAPGRPGAGPRLADLLRPRRRRARPVLLRADASRGRARSPAAGAPSPTRVRRLLAHRSASSAPAARCSAAASASWSRGSVAARSTSTTSTISTWRGSASRRGSASSRVWRRRSRAACRCRPRRAAARPRAACCRRGRRPHDAARRARPRAARRPRERRPVPARRGAACSRCAGGDRVRWLDGMISADVESPRGRRRRARAAAHAPGTHRRRPARARAERRFWLELEAARAPRRAARGSPAT